MPDVFFITNRALVGPASLPESYTGTLGDGGLRTGIARVTPADTAALREGSIASIGAAAADEFSATAAGELKKATNLLFFIHGFANTFSDAITRAAFNRDFLAASGVPAADCTVLTFTWPSPGVTVTIQGVVGTLATLAFTPFVSLVHGRLITPAAAEYLADQKRATDSADGLVSAFDRLVPVFEAVRKRGGKCFLMAHSMGHQILAAALARPQAPTSILFDEAFLCAGDHESAPAGMAPAWIKTLQMIAKRVHIYASEADDILKVSQGVNGHERLGQRGEAGLDFAKVKGVRRIDCTGTKPLDATSDGTTGHYYYRRVPAVRDDIAAAMAGKKMGAVSLPE